MIARVIDAKYLGDFVVWLRFNDGVEGEIDLSAELSGQIFEPLRDPDYFVQGRLDPEVHTLVWPNGADFAPEFLHDQILVPASVSA